MHIGGDSSKKKIKKKQLCTKKNNKLTNYPKLTKHKNVHEMAFNSSRVEAVFLVKQSPS